MEDIDQRIDALEREPVELRTQRNALTPICHLPTETLVDILYYIQHGGRTHSELRPWETYDPVWVGTMRVCRRFRDVALGTPKLWTFADVDETRAESQAWTELVFQRARKAIAIRYKAFLGTGPDFLTRARSVDVVVHEDAVELPSFFDQPAPLLEHVKLELSPGCGQVDSSFLGGAGTTLLELSLTHASIRKDPPQMSSLCRLELIRVESYAGTATLAELLSYMPQLQTLCLQYLSQMVLPRPSSSGSVRRSPTLLPNLQALFIEDSCRLVAEYMDVLPLPFVSFGLTLRDMSHGRKRSAENYARAYSSWAQFTSARPLLVEHSVVVTHKTQHPLLIIGLPVPISDFGRATSDSFLAVHSRQLRPHPVIGGVDTLRITQPAHYDQLLFLSLDEQYGVKDMLDLRVVVLDGLHPVGDEFDHFADRIVSWVAARTDRVTDVRFVDCSDNLCAVAEDLRLLGLNVTWEG